MNDQHLPAKDLILQQLLPMAREGLQSTGIDADDIDRYLGVLEDRVTMRRTGARWALESLHNMQDKGTLDQRLRCLVSSMVAQQTSGRPRQDISREWQNTPKRYWTPSLKWNVPS